MLLVVAVAFTVFSCTEERATLNSIKENVFSDDDYIEAAVEVFREPSGLKIDYKKARNFNKASEALVIMGQEWAEKMSKVDDDEKLKLAASYEKAQDDLIRKFGICGKEEYKWIYTKALLDSSNKDVFNRAGIWIKQ